MHGMQKLIERAIVKRTIRDLLKAGYTLGVNDGEEIVLRNCADPKVIFEAMFSTDEDYLLVYKAGSKKAFGWVRFIYGNDGWDVMADHTMNLEPDLKGASDYADRINERLY